MSVLTLAITEIQSLLDQTKAEILLLESGRKASGPRARKHIQSIKTSAHALRKSITEHVSTIPVKKRVVKVTPVEPVVVEPVVVEPVVKAPVKAPKAKRVLPVAK